MSELYFGYASFVYFICKKGYSVQPHAISKITQANNWITFWYEGKESPDEYDPYQVKYKSEADCGCVVINAEVLDERFEKDANLVNTLKKSCKRIKRTIPNKTIGKTEIDVTHCYEPGHKTTIHNGDEVSCARNKD